MNECDCHWKLASLLGSQVSSWLARNFETLSQKKNRHVQFSIIKQPGKGWLRLYLLCPFLTPCIPGQSTFCHLVHFHPSILRLGETWDFKPHFVRASQD